MNERKKIQKRFAEMYNRTPREDLYSYWPGDDIRHCRHAYVPHGDNDWCHTCGESAKEGIHLKDDNGRVMVYPSFNIKKKKGL